MEKDEVCLKIDKRKVCVEEGDNFMLDVESQRKNKSRTYINKHTVIVLSYLVIILLYVISEQTKEKYTLKEETISKNGVNSAKYDMRRTYINKHTVTVLSYLISILEWLYEMSLLLPCLEFFGFSSHVIIVINNSCFVLKFTHSNYPLCGEAFKRKGYVTEKFKDFLVRYKRTLAF